MYYDGKGGKLKKTDYTGGRGYCGWHETWYGGKVFLRSLQEKICALVLDEEKVYYKCECQIYLVGNRRYKPDFFIYKNSDFTGLYKILEIKDTNKKRENVINCFRQFFESLGIEYDSPKYDSRQLKRKYKEQLEEFIKNSNRVDMRGSNNPRYGVKLTPEQHERQCKIQKEAQNRPEVIEAHRNASIQMWKRDSHRKMMKEAFRKREEKNKIKKEEKKKELLGDIVTVHCNYCNEDFEIREKEINYRGNIKRDWCRKNCCVQKALQKNNLITKANKTPEINERAMKNAIKTFAKRIIDHYGTISFDIIKKAKIEGVILRNAQIGERSIKRYFTDIYTLTEAVKNEN